MKTLLCHTLAAFAGVALAGVATAQNRSFTSQYSFGDSLSDSGNARALTGGLVPPAAYFQGRFSNGPVFIELLGNTLTPGFVPSGVSALRPNLNFAVGGSNAGAGGSLPNFAQQIGQYSLVGARAQSTDLFTVLAGANDLITTLASPTTPANPAALDAAGAAAAQAVASGVQTLIGLGAKNIAVAGLPNLGATPRSLAAGGLGGAGATFGLRASVAFNDTLKARLATLAAGAPDVNITYIDLHGVLDRVALDFAKLGFNNASSFALAPTTAGGGGGNAAGYVFWDDIHPTAATHALLASIVLEELNPEPVLGFGATTASAALALQGIGASTIETRLSQLAASKRTTGRADVYATFNYADAARRNEGWRPKFEYDAQLLTAGVDLRASEGFFFGGALDTGRLDATVRGGRGDFRVESTTGRLYGLWHGGHVSLVLDGDYGAVNVKKIRRTTAFGGLQTNGKTSGTHWGFGGRAIWALDGGGFEVRPWLGLRTERVKLDGYTEHDVASLAMSFDEQETKSTAGSIGVDLGTAWKLAGRAARFDFRAAWISEIGNKDRAVTGRLANNFTRPTTISIEDGDGDGLELGGAATVWFTKNWSTSLGYTGGIRSGEKLASRFSLSLQTGF